MARIYWHETSAQSREFTSKLLQWWYRQHGGEIVASPLEADIVCASICSPREIGILTQARRLADGIGRPLLVGGPETYTGSTYLAWADYLCVGEGYQLLAKLAAEADPVAVLDACPHVLSRSDPRRLVAPDYTIPWGYLPAVQTAARGFYFLAGRGCRSKCKFCMTSWTQPHTSADRETIERAERQVREMGGKLVWVSNDAGEGEGAGSTMLKTFIRNAHTRKWPTVVRLGVEGVTERRRRWFGKPMSDDDIAAAITMAKEIGRQLELFYIIGWPDDPPPAEWFEPIIQRVGLERCRAPRIYVKYTWFEPSPHTPLATWNVSQLTKVEYEAAHRELRRYSGRYRLFRAGKIGAAVWSAVFRRLEAEAAATWAPLYHECAGMTVADVCNLAARMVGSSAVDGSGVYPWQRVQCNIK